MSGPLAGRRALVTGVSRRQGIGAAIARRLAGAGADLVLQGFAEHDAQMPWGADPAAPDELLAELRGLGRRVEHIDGDLAAPQAPAALVDACHDLLGGLDLLVANHARSSDERLAEVSAAELDACLTVNVRATLLLVQRFAARVGSGGGRVVLLTSGQHLGAMTAAGIGYVASKGALQQLTRTLAAELASRAVTVNTVNPGPTESGWIDAELRGRLLASAPAGRLSLPDDAARLIAWLCSEDARWVTGQTIDSEGGFSR